MNLPYTCPPETISSGVAMANHVFLIADRHHAGHEWLYQPGHPLSTLAKQRTRNSLAQPQPQHHFLHVPVVWA